MKIDYRPFKKMEPISQLKYFFEIYQLPELEELQKILAINTKDWNRDIFMNIFDTIFAKAKKEWSEINEYFEKKQIELYLLLELTKEKGAGWIVANWIKFEFIADLTGAKNWEVLEDALNEINYKENSQGGVASHWWP